MTSPASGSYEKRRVKKIRWLTQILIISLSANVSLLATLCYFVVRDKSTTLNTHSSDRKRWFSKCSKRAQFSKSNEELLISYANLSFSELTSLLSDRELVEEGYAKRDLSLSALVNYHDFDIEKALGGYTPEKRKIELSSQRSGVSESIDIYPGLSDFHFAALVDFIKIERWPLTPQGIFHKLQKAEKGVDPSLLQLFTTLPGYRSIKAIFSRSHADITEGELIALLRSGEWGLVEKYSQIDEKTEEGATDLRRELLGEYLQKGSRLAAHFLLKFDSDFALKKMDNQEVSTLVELSSRKQLMGKKFAIDLLASRRPDRVRELAAKYLYEVEGEEMPVPFSYTAAMMRFAPEYTEIEEERVYAVSMEKMVEETAHDPQMTVHTVSAGDNLWKIAKKHGISIQSLRDENNLESDVLRPGQQLYIPD